MYYKFDCLIVNRTCVNKNGTGKFVSLNRTCISK